MACPSACCCACASSHGLPRFRPPLRLLAASSTCRSGRISLVFPLAPSPRLSSRIPASAEPPLDDTTSTDEVDDWSAADDEEEDQDERIGFQIKVSKIGKRNRRLVRARVRVDAPLEAVWATLTDYEGLADFIPGLSECRLLDQGDGFARLYQVRSLMTFAPIDLIPPANEPIPANQQQRQVGEQDLALGFKFNAKGTIDCYEGEMESLPAAGARRREIAFNMVQGDFKVFQGKWSVEQVDGPPVEVQVEGGGDSEEHEYQTTLSYLVELEPKLWVPVRLLEGRICSEIKNNLVSIREQAQRIKRTSDN